MNNRNTPRNVALVVALTAIAATAWGTNEISAPTWVPAYDDSPEQSDAMRPAENLIIEDENDVPMPATEPVVREPLPASERAMSEPAQPAPVPAKPRVMPLEAAAIPAPDSTASQPPITVEERRLTEDERIQAQVMDKLANNPRLSGRIAVEARNSEVWLSGYTATAGQAWHAGRDAGSVVGVRYVHNEIRPRVGGSI